MTFFTVWREDSFLLLLIQWYAALCVFEKQKLAIFASGTWSAGPQKPIKSWPPTNKPCLEAGHSPRLPQNPSPGYVSPSDAYISFMLTSFMVRPNLKEEKSPVHHAVPPAAQGQPWAVRPVRSGLQKLGGSKNCYANNPIKLQVPTNIRKCSYIAYAQLHIGQFINDNEF